MATVTFRLPDEELGIIKLYAELNNASLSETIRSSVLEYIELQHDLKAFAEFEKEKANGTLKTRPFEEFVKELDL